MAATPLVGQTLGKYRVLEPLGRGGMARVYRAYHPQLDRYVAIKVLRSDLVEQDEAGGGGGDAGGGAWRARFQREAQAVAALRHPNIIQVFDTDVEGDVSYIVLELLEGDTLKTRLNDYRVRGEKMPLGEMVRVMLDVLDGLGYAHDEGMVHRDVKPSNVLLTRRGEAVITDFGIAQIVGGTRHTITGALMGTLHYMAPEQGLKGQVDARSDIYSLGIVLYEMLTQRTPFDADTPLAILMKHLNDPLPLPRQIDPAIPAPFERVVLKAVAKQPEDRFQNAQAMALALSRAAEEAEIELPERISLPLSFTTVEAPSESVAVLSGPARERITDSGFANGETDATLGERLAAERAKGRRRRRTERGKRKRRAGTLGSAILAALGLVAACNLAAATLGGLARWTVFERGWPMELFLAAAGLSIVMAATASVGLLIPVGALFGTGLLLALTSLTGRWEWWDSLWVLQVWAIIIPVVASILLARRPDRSRRLSRYIGSALGWGAFALSILVTLVALVIPVR